MRLRSRTASVQLSTRPDRLSFEVKQMQIRSSDRVQSALNGGSCDGEIRRISRTFGVKVGLFIEDQDIGPNVVDCCLQFRSVY